MKVFKFGGASIKSAEAVKNLTEIIKIYIGYELVIVVSAMGKTTNKLEKLCEDFFFRDRDINLQLHAIESFHKDLAMELFGNEMHDIFKDIDEIIHTIKNKCLKLKRAEASYDFIYDQVVSEGEMLSSLIVAQYLNDCRIYTHRLDARKMIRTNDQYREAIVNWDESANAVREHITFEDNCVYVTQGFIGSCDKGHATTLGREGSDFSAAIFANVLEAKEVVIWKDVPGLLNADPKFFSNTKKLDNISYHEAVELAYFGASVIHPKTIKPLQNKGIPLFVKSFKDVNKKGSLIDENSSEDSLIPSYIFKSDQVLVSISTRDYSFIDEKHLALLFRVFDKHRIKVNLMENSAISFTICFDFNEQKLEQLIDELSKSYKVLYNRNVELMTVRHYDQATIDKLVANKEILVEQKSRHTARMVMKNKV